MALNIALVAGSSYLLADIVTQVAAEAIEPDAVEPVTDSDPAGGDVRRVAAAPSTILDRNLFGAQLAGEAQVPAESSEPLARTKLPLRLLGTAAASAEARSRAAIENEKTRKHMVVAVGDAIEGHRGVRVDAIERTRVVLDNSGRPEELLLHEDQPKAARRTPRARPARRRALPTESAVRDRLKKIAGQDGQGITNLLSQARITPHYDQGEVLGMKIDAIKSGSLYETAGLQNGDIIKEVNGIVIDRQDATQAVLEELMNADTIDIAAERGGSPIKLSADAVRLLEDR